MLYLVSHVAGDRVAIPADRVVEVLPMVAVSAMAQPTAHFAGVIRYRGCFLLTFDLSQAVAGAPSPRLLSTRILVLRLSGTDASPTLAGMIAERATSVMRISDSDFQNPASARHRAGLLDGIAFDKTGAIRRLSVEAVASLMSSNSEVSA
ncbi:MAG: chemotaxis protein CheW [Verrucomicrobia bacterium]|nr:chemotaxis protein CheW [Verrucomicrobiota bacterium]